MENRATVEPNDVVALHSSLKPLYHSLGQVIRGRIQSGEWQVGQRIPSERAFMHLYGVSRATVRQGIDNLVKEGILHRVHGKGTFVAPPKVKQGVLRLRDFTQTMQRSGLKTDARILGKETVIPPLNVQQTLALAPGERVTGVQRLLLVNQLPMMIETSYVSAVHFPDLLATYPETEDLETFIATHYDVYIAREDETFEPVILESEEAGLLGVKAGFPALWIEVVARNTAGQPIIFRTSLLRGDRCRFYIDLALG